MIAEIDWDSVFLNADVDECWSTWRSIFMRIMDLCIPSSTLKPRKNLPWLTKPIIQLMRKRNTLFRAASKTKTEAAVTKYKCVRNRVVAMLRTSKSKYFRNLGHPVSKRLLESSQANPETRKLNPGPEERTDSCDLQLGQSVTT